MDVSQKLNFRNRQKAVVGKSDRGSQNSLFIEQRIEHTTRPKLFVKPIRHVIDAAFLSHVFTEYNRAGVAGESFCKPHIDQFRQVKRTLKLWILSPVHHLHLLITRYFLWSLRVGASR
jgi:hypothetical protein